MYNGMCVRGVATRVAALAARACGRSVARVPLQCCRVSCRCSSCLGMLFDRCIRAYLLVWSGRSHCRPSYGSSQRSRQRQGGVSVLTRLLEAFGCWQPPPPVPLRVLLWENAPAAATKTRLCRPGSSHDWHSHWQCAHTHTAPFRHLDPPLLMCMRCGARTRPATTFPLVTDSSVMGKYRRRRPTRA